MRVAQAAGMETALRALDCMMGSAGGIVPLFQEHGQPRGGRSSEVAWHTPLSRGSADRLVRNTRTYDERWSTEILMGAPQTKISRDPHIHMVPILWARVEGKEQLKHAHRFRPLPTMVLSEGATSRKLLIWWVRPIDYFDAEDFNRRIAYKLRAVQKHGAPERLRIPLPGTCLRVGRSRPVPIVVSRLRPELYDAGAIASRLRKPPEVDFSQFRKSSNK